MRFVPPTAYVEPMATARPDPARLGGKGAALVRLLQLGHRVPPGFVVTIDAFGETVEHILGSGALDRLAAELALGETAHALGLQKALLTGPIPAPILRPIREAVYELWTGDRGDLIARSSATGEDTLSHSFAGIFESLPLAGPDEFEPAIRRVWASVLSPRALSYIRDRGLTAIPRMAVVVQQFLDAVRSGVMFTKFPAPDGERRILVEHVEGGCEKLVKGEVTPQRLWLDREASTIDGDEGALGTAHARDLARLAVDLEDIFGEPQDVEWVIHGGAVHLVQSRPVTAAFVPRPGPSLAKAASSAEPLLSGVAASPGAGAGPVHLVFNIDQALALAAGQVLVTPMTNPDMVVSMRNSAAIVTDVGGMICHAAIVSRELGLPCVVGTKSATATLLEDQAVTVDGSSGTVYEGVLTVERPEEGALATWKDLWAFWHEAVGGRSDVVPVLSCLAALEAIPPSPGTVVLVPDLDLRADPYGLWNDLEGMSPEARARALDRYVRRVADVAARRGLSRVLLLPVEGFAMAELPGAVERSGRGLVVVELEGEELPIILDPLGPLPEGPAAVPLGCGALARTTLRGQGPRRPRIGGIDEGREAALDTIRFFGHQPGVKVAGMPRVASRRRWWALLPEYGRFHSRFRTESDAGKFEWLEVRPELVLSPLLKSLVQPGFEMVPRILGFPDAPPMHIKWIRCRYHFRSDTFTRVWRSIVRATWDEKWLARLIRRVRASYAALAEVMVLFPTTQEELGRVSGDRMVALVTSWWPRWVEFFSLCWFIQAQGDDIVFPFVEETVRDNLERLGPPPEGLAWPGLADLVAPTTPVMSAEYMADVGALREALLAAGLTSPGRAEEALVREENPDVATRVGEHLRKWHWMRDRDLLFEPWDTPYRVVETALKTTPHAAPRYADNLRRNLLALSLHWDLAHASGRAQVLHHAARFLHDLNVERENHHVLWLKHSYPLRRLFLEAERRLIAAGSLSPGDVFFLQAPELIDATRNLPAPLTPELTATVRNRRVGFLHEARLKPPQGLQGLEPQEEDDYY
jgi:phosphohistidine swiveling domain-containing protein